MRYSVRPVVVAEVEACLRVADDIRRQSGRDGAPIFAPRSADEPPRLPTPERVAELQAALALPTTEPAWFRAFVVLAGRELVGELTLNGGRLPSERHRGLVGMGILAAHCGRGLGEQLLSAAIAWALADPGVEWLDLGVFGGNDRALSLYTRLGFVETGRTVDRFRVEGRKITDIQMALRVRA